MISQEGSGQNLKLLDVPRNKDAEGTEKRLAEREGSREMWCLRSSSKGLIQRKKKGHTVKGCQGVNITSETQLLYFPLASAGTFTQADSGEVLYHEGRQLCVKGKVPEDTRESESTEHCGQQVLRPPSHCLPCGASFLGSAPNVCGLPKTMGRTTVPSRYPME